MNRSRKSDAVGGMAATDGPVPVRIYAPVGSHKELLAYLVRRLLENGANSSFVNRLVDPAVSIDDLVAEADRVTIRWTLRGTLTLRGQTRPITVHVTLKDGQYTGETTVKQTDFGIKPPGKAGVRAKDEVRIEFDVRLAS